MAIQFLVQFSNGYSKMVANNTPVLGWSVRTGNDHSKTRHVRFSDVCLLYNLIIGKLPLPDFSRVLVRSSDYRNFSLVNQVMHNLITRVQSNLDNRIAISGKSRYTD
jgi:hypothetical protein